MEQNKVLKHKLNMLFRKCVQDANLLLLNKNEVKKKIEDALTDLKREIMPMLASSAKLTKGNSNSEGSVSFDDTASVSSQFSKYYQLSYFPSELAKKDLFKKTVRMNMTSFKEVTGEVNGELVGLIKMDRSVRIAPITKRTDAIPISVSEYRLKAELNDSSVKAEFFGRFTAAAQSFLSLVENPSQKLTSRFNYQVLKLIDEVKEQMFNEFTLQAVVFSVCWVAAKFSENCQIVGFERSFNTNRKGTTNSIEVDGSVVVGSTFVLLEFKHHGRHHKKDAIASILNRNYNGKIVLSENYKKAVCFGFNFEGIGFADSNTKRLETSLIQSKIKNKNIFFSKDDKSYVSERSLETNNELN